MTMSSISFATSSNASIIALEVLEHFARDHEADGVGRTHDSLNMRLSPAAVDLVGLAFHPHQPLGQFVQALAVAARRRGAAAWLPRSGGRRRR